MKTNEIIEELFLEGKGYLTSNKKIEVGNLVFQVRNENDIEIFQVKYQEEIDQNIQRVIID